MVVIEIDEGIVAVKLDEDENEVIKRFASKQDILEREALKYLIQKGLQYGRTVS